MKYLSLENVLIEYFNCKKPFKKNGTLSQSGEKAYARLVSLLADIDNLIDINFSSKIDELDELAPSDEENMSKFVDKYGNIID